MKLDQDLPPSCAQNHINVRKNQWVLQSPGASSMGFNIDMCCLTSLSWSLISGGLAYHKIGKLVAMISVGKYQMLKTGEDNARNVRQFIKLSCLSTQPLNIRWRAVKKKELS